MAATVYERDNCGAGPCLSTRYRPCTQAQKWTLGPCVQTVSNLLVLWQSTSLFSELSSCLKTVAVRAKWSNCVHSHILVLSVNTASFCAGTQALVPQVPEHQVQTAP